MTTNFLLRHGGRAFLLNPQRHKPLRALHKLMGGTNKPLTNISKVPIIIHTPNHGPVFYPTRNKRSEKSYLLSTRADKDRPLRECKESIGASLRQCIAKAVVPG